MMLREGTEGLHQSTTGIRLREGGYTVRMIKAEDDLVKAYRLRHRIFAEKLRWVPVTKSELEIDGYDADAEHLGVFDADNRLLAYVRLLSADRRYMLEDEFRIVLGPGGTFLKSGDTCELTRFCVDQQTRQEEIVTPFGTFPLFMLLFKGVYHWGMQHGAPVLYAVTDRIVYKLLCMRGFPCERLGPSVRMPDGVVAVGLRMDWRNCMKANGEKRPGLAAWYAQNSISLLSSAMATA
ncbi:MAG: GNAT family N-acetyltransferase [Nitrospiraceae bacterium]|nr:GNAT family N-acetyltransferase [Nitrospiraceae bacterium]